MNSSIATPSTSSDSNLDKPLCTEPSGSDSVSSPVARRPIPRKGHTKSRRGCFNCKRRRIKCNENYPECNHCNKAGLDCEYPANIIQAAQRLNQPPAPKDAVTLRSTPGNFTMSDMRLFHHFLITAYPHLPVGADKIWITVIPSFAHNYEFLIHSILALSASHLDAVSSANVAEEALSHRILAMKSLNDALSHPAKTRCESDARMAAALALAFQSSHLRDGLYEFLTMVRGCNLIAGKDQLMNADSAFHAFRAEGHLATMQNRLANSAYCAISPDHLDRAAESLEMVETLALADWERAFYSTLVQTVQHAYNDPVAAYTTFVTTYNIPSTWTHEEFQTFIDPNNCVAQILLAHWIAIQAILTPILMFERLGFQGVNAPSAFMEWILNIYRSLPASYRSHVEWCRTISTYPFHRFHGALKKRQLEIYDPAFNGSLQELTNGDS
ncbi:hypothetical protein BU16DRAFT_141498 [Lophium mytilinum]|uniref:Zn(2)-C6 fungal-type domain-containing protein n=1 Tax=Lophium mytilinum TaxID=390894 RepID=A0A6A6QGA1_9PEZI|nr:hypothetical protein BU16DRAFT_141498 [Lophium mytilinum]